MEIEKKYRVKNVPDNLERYKKKSIEQGYLCIEPVVRIRKSNDDYILTYKSKIGLAADVGKETCINNEMEALLTEEGYMHLKEKIDGYLIQKTRYCMPIHNGLIAELDIFHGHLEGLIVVEVEFESEEAAMRFTPPEWFGQEVSSDKRFGNNYLCQLERYSE